MNSSSMFYHKTIVAIALLLPTLAAAHAGHGDAHGWLSGIAHPFGGFDHLLAMISVGLWAAQLGGKALWRVPLTFVAVMALGNMLGMAALPLPFIETGILMSLLVLGMLIAAAVQLPLAASAAIVGLFALFHGHAHGTEMPLNADGLGYALGFLLATATLHGIGIAAARYARHAGMAKALRYAGGLIAASAGYLWLTA